MNDQSARHVASDYLASLTDDEARQFIDEARTRNGLRDIARTVFAPRVPQNRWTLNLDGK